MPSYIATKNVRLRIGDKNASFSFSYMVCHIVVAGNRAQRPTQTTLKNCRAAVRLEKSSSSLITPSCCPGLLPLLSSLSLRSSIPHPDSLGASSPALWADRKTTQPALQAHPVTTRYKAMILWPLETYRAGANAIDCRRS